MAEAPEEKIPSGSSQRHIPKLTPPSLEKLSTGSAATDAVLGGGIPRNSLYVISGPPGAGKTIFAQQITFAAAKNGKRVIYFTNVSEPHAKLVQHIQQFDFYERNLVGNNIQIYNVTGHIRDKGIRETFNFIVDTIRAERADLVVIDSFRGLKHILKITEQERSEIFELAAKISITGCTGILVGEYTPQEIQTDPEFAVADGIINLQYETRSIEERRTIRITKMRGVKYLGGQHSFKINETGIEAYPRQETLSQAPTYRATKERISVGIEALDKMLYGGVIRSSSTLLAGAAGVGKTLLSLHFLAAGAAKGEGALLVSFQENPEQVLERASEFGLAGHLKMDDILSISPVELDVDMAASYIRRAVETRKPRRVVIDSVAELEYAVHRKNRFDDFLAALIGYFRSREVTTVMTREIAQVFGTELSITSRGLSYIVDNIVLMQYVELEAEVRRAITILKTRGSNHDKKLHELLISDGNISIGEQFKGLSGLLTGIPRN